MNIGKRKADECHYCTNQKRHDRKRSKLTISDLSEPMIPVQANFKCRGRGGKEIEFTPDDGVPLNGLKKSPYAADTGQNVISDRNYGHDQKMNFKPMPKRSVRFKTDRPKYGTPHPSRLSRSGRSEVSWRSDSMDKIWLSSIRPQPEIRSSADKLSTESEENSEPESVVSVPQYHVRSPDKISLLGPTHSDGRSSTDESSVTATCLTRSRGVRKAVSVKPASRNSKCSSISRTRKTRYVLSLAEESRSSRTSNESVHEYLINVSEELRREQLLGKLDRTDQQTKKSSQSDGFLQNLDHEGEDSLKGSSKYKKMKSNSTYSSNQSFLATGRTKPLSFLIRVIQLFSLGCWKTDINSTSSSEDRISEVSTISECGDSSSSESSSTSTGTTTVAAVAGCGRPSARTRSHDAKSTGEALTTKSRRSSDSGDHRLISAKLVDSLKRFFSRHRKSNSNRREPYEESESTSDSSSSSADSNSEPSSSAPLNPKYFKQKSSPNPKQQSSVLKQLKTSAPASRNHRESPECEGSNTLLLGDPAESLLSILSTENESSGTEIVDICPMHKQPF